MQRPVKESWDRVVKGVDRITKLLEITKMTPADQTEARLLLDKAAEIADLIKKDGSWGAHASHYTKDRLAAAESYLAKAQGLIDNGAIATRPSNSKGTWITQDARQWSVNNGLRRASADQEKNCD